MALTQEPFMYSPGHVGDSSIGHLWEVPTLLRTIGDGKTGGSSRDTSFTRGLLETGELVVELDGSGPAIVNAGGTGVYRVQYAPDHLLALADQLSDLSTLERFYLFSDTWAAVLAGKSELADFLSLAEAIREPTRPRRLGSGDRAARTHEPRRARRPARRPRSVCKSAHWSCFRAARMGGTARRQRADPSAPRAQLLSSLGTVGADPAIRSRCAELHRAFLEDGVELDPELAQAIVMTVAVSSGREVYDAFVERFRNARTPQEELRYLIALAGFNDLELAERTFNFALTEVRTQNAPLLLNVLLGNRVAGPSTWRRVTENGTRSSRNSPGPW